MVINGKLVKLGKKPANKEVIARALENYRDGAMYVSRSIWNGRTTEPKTRTGRAPVPVIRQLAERLEMHRLRCGNPQPGPIFANMLGKPLSLNNVLKRVIVPALNRCEVCRKGESDHRKANHAYKRDSSIPEWHGWHAEGSVAQKGDLAPPLSF